MAHSYPTEQISARKVKRVAQGWSRGSLNRRQGHSPASFQRHLLPEAFLSRSLSCLRALSCTAFGDIRLWPGYIPWFRAPGDDWWSSAGKGPPRPFLFSMSFIYKDVLLLSWEALKALSEFKVL